MAKTKSTKTFAETNNRLFQLIKNNITDSYFLEVLYYHIRKALSKKDFNLADVEILRISGKYMGYDIVVNLNGNFSNVIRSLNIALSLRAFMLDSSYLKTVYDDKLLFGTIDSYFLSWESHRAIMEQMCDEDFSIIYEMIVKYLENRIIPQELKDAFNERTIDPGYHHLRDFCEKLSGRDDYHGRTVIKNNAFLYDEMEEFVVNQTVDYVGNTAFAYCNNLKEITFENKVLFGKFPIIECPNLKKIKVPTDLLDYYKECLPYYCNIITDGDEEMEKLQVNKPEMEVVYVDVNSTGPYTEIELEAEQIEEPDDKIQEEDKEPIDYSKLKKVYEKMASSYKFFWMMAIISLAKENNYLSISFKDITIRMAAMAWSIVFDNDIDLGNTDMMKKYLEGVVKNTKLIEGASSKVVEEYLHQHYASQGVDKILAPLLKNVPYRFLSPWIKYTTDEDVIAKSCEKNYKGLYALHSDFIVLDEEWWDYIDAHYQEVCEFSMDSFIEYAKKYNNGIKLLKLMTTGWPLIIKNVKG